MSLEPSPTWDGAFTARATLCALLSSPRWKAATPGASETPRRGECGEEELGARNHPSSESLGPPRARRGSLTPFCLPRPRISRVAAEAVNQPPWFLGVRGAAGEHPPGSVSVQFRWRGLLPPPNPGLRA